MPNDYHTQAQLDRTKRLRELQHELPDFCSDYFMAIEQQTSVLTRLSYAYDLKLFFQYLSSELPKFSGKPRHRIHCGRYHSGYQAGFGTLCALSDALRQKRNT